MSTSTYTPRLQTKYHTEVIPALMKKFSYSSVMQVPKITKICLNRGVNGAVADKKLIDIAIDELTTVTGQKAVATKSKGTAVIVSHGDVIKAICASALGVHLDEFQRIVIDPASISILDYSAIKPRVLLLNDSRSVVTDLLKAPSRKRNLLGGGSGK